MKRVDAGTIGRDEAHVQAEPRRRRAVVATGEEPEDRRRAIRRSVADRTGVLLATLETERRKHHVV